jgi:flagellar basal-body rod protein FlgB
VKLFDRTLTTLERSLDARLLRQNVLAGNLANANTPGYAPRDVDFAAAMAQSAPGAAGGVPPPGVQGEGFLPLGGELAPLRVADATPLTPGVLAAETSSVMTAGAATSPGMDGNAVDLDRTMVALAQNSLQYSAAARAAQKKLAILRYVASDGVG